MQASIFLTEEQKLVAGQPVWAKLFYLVRTGHMNEALQEALLFQQAIEHREASFVNHFRTWIESSDRKYVDNR
jgi:nuclear pore complex protein Nup93